MGHITSDYLEQSRIVLPPLPLAERFSEIVNPFFEQRLALHRENRKLLELKNFTTPLFMNGQLHILKGGNPK